MELLLLIAVILISLFMIPLGLPGLWIMIASAFVYRMVLPGSIGVVTLAGIVILGVIAEVFEFTLSGQYARKYGGSRRASWGAMVGGVLGAIFFFPIPIPFLGPVVGGMVGAFVGAFVGELSRRDQNVSATKVATGAMIGRAVAAAMKTGVGVVVAVWVIVAAL